MTWPISVFRGDPADLEDESRFAPLDLERARAVIRSSPAAAAEGEADVEESAKQIVIGRDATMTDFFLVFDDDGVGRAVEAEIYEQAASDEELRSDLEKLLDLFFTLGEELDAWVFDHQSDRFVTRAQTRELVVAYVGG